MNDLVYLYLLIFMCLLPFLGVAALMFYITRPNKDDLEQQEYLKGIYGTGSAENGT